MRLLKIAFVIILLLAILLRFYRIDAQSLWADEGSSVVLASRPFTTIVQSAARDIHPPLYYFSLRIWVGLLGKSEIALRSLSALYGLALVALTFILGRKLFGPGVGLLSAFLAAISPFQIYYSQETRMYILAAMLGALSFFFFVRWLEVETRRVGQAASDIDPPPRMVAIQQWMLNIWDSRYFVAAGYLLTTLFALYTHYFAFTIPLAQNVIYPLWLAFAERWRRPRLILKWVALQLVIVALYLPWLGLSWGQLQSWPAISEPFSLSYLWGEVFRIFSLGLSVEPRTSFVVWGFLAIFLLGLVPWPGQDQRSGLCFELVVSLAYFAVPVLTMYFLSLARPLYNPKLILLATPGFHLILARGVLAPAQGLSRLLAMNLRHELAAIWPVTALLFVIATNAQSLNNYYFDPHYARDDYRGIAAFITASADEDDAILINAPGQIEIFSYYYKGSLSIYPLPQQRPLDEQQTLAELEGLVARHDRIFGIFWATDESDPHRFIETWLDEHTYKAQDRWYGNVRLVLYGVPMQVGALELKRQVQARLGEEIMLLGYDLPSTEVRAGDILQLTLVWRALTSPEQRYVVFTHLLDDHDQIVGQRDAEPGGGAKLTSTWQEGEIIADNYGLLVLPGTPPGEYDLEVGMYSLATGERLSIRRGDQMVGDRLLLDTVLVQRPEQPPSVEALGIQHQRPVQYGPLRLLGYDLYKLGFAHKADEPLYPGDILHVVLYWQRTEESTAHPGLTLKLTDGRGQVRASSQGQPGGEGYPFTTWQTGEIVRDQYNLFLPLDLSPGAYNVVLEMAADASTWPAVTLQTITVWR